VLREQAEYMDAPDRCSSLNKSSCAAGVVHTWRIQQEIPKATALATAEFATLSLRLLNVAARVIESATRIRIAFASACPDAAAFQTIATALRPAPT